MWKKGAHVIIIDFVYHKKNDVKSKSFRFAKIVEIGKCDLLVQPRTTWSSSRLLIIPKKSCIMIDEHSIDAKEVPQKPEIGDLVCAYTHSFSGKTDYNIGHVYEKKYSPGHQIEYLVKIGNKEKWFSLDCLLVLEGDRNDKPLRRNK